MSLLDDASLILTPNGYKENVAYTLKPTAIADGNFDVVRNTTATRVNENGLIESVVANVPRIDYKDGKAGWLIEPQRTNLLLRSEEFDNAYWDNIGTISLTPNNRIAPDGTLTADKLEITSNIQRIQRIESFGAGTFTLSLYVYSETALVFRFFIRVDGTFVSQTFTTTANQWQRFEYTITATTDLDSVQIFRGGTDNGDFWIWGAQLEEGSEATSYIPTEATAVTRNADVATVAPPIGTTEIVEYFTDGTTNTITSIPATYQLPNGKIEKVIMT